MNLQIQDAGLPPQHWDVSDWLIMVLVVSGWGCAWAFTFLHPDSANFGICAGATMANIGAYQALRIHDDKKPDAQTR